MKVLIIEDEPITARELKFILRKIEPSIEILDTIDSIEGSIEFLQTLQPDLIFSDIHLADGRCFEIFKNIEVKSPIIFCTAYDEYAIEAFKTNGVAYILKPFDEQTVAEALNKVKMLFNNFGIPPSVSGTISPISPTLSSLDLEALARIIGHQDNYKSSFLVAKGGKLMPIDASNVAFFYIRNEVTLLHTLNGDTYITDYTLENLEHEVNPHDFYRANRQFLINRRTVKEIDHYFARKLLVKTHTPTPEPLIISKAKATHFTKWLETKRS